MERNTETTIDFGSKLKTAREALGLSPRLVASKISRNFSISHATICNYEAGRTYPSIDVLAILASFYGRPLNWFFEKTPCLTNIHYRNLKSRVRAADLRRYEADAERWLEAYFRLETALESPLGCRNASFDPAIAETGRALAENLRSYLGLKDSESIRSVVELLEDFSIRTIEIPTDLSVDGMAAKYDNNYVIVLNPRVSNDRCRMNAAHELGHVLAGDCASECGHEHNITEKRAYDFASHLLLPESQLWEAFRGQSMVKLVKFKEYYGISLQAMIYRAEQTSIITKSAVKWLRCEFAKRGWRKDEPGFVRPDRATRFEDLLARSLAEGRLNWASAAKLMQVSEKELNARMKLALGSEQDSVSEEGGDIVGEGPGILSFQA